MKARALSILTGTALVASVCMWTLGGPVEPATPRSNAGAPASLVAADASVAPLGDGLEAAIAGAVALRASSRSAPVGEPVDTEASEDTTTDDGLDQARRDRLALAHRLAELDPEDAVAVAEAKAEWVRLNR